MLADSSDQALLLLPFETLTALNAEGWPARPGDLGENITTSGVAYGQFQPGNRYRIGESVVEISKPCLPCSYLELLPFVGKARGDAFRRAVTGRRGWFARVLQSGRVEPGDPIIRIFGIRAMADLSEGNA